MAYAISGLVSDWVLDAFFSSDVVVGGSFDNGLVEGSVVCADLSLMVSEVSEEGIGEDSDIDTGVSITSNFIGLVPTSAEAYSRLKRCGSWKSS